MPELEDYLEWDVLVWSKALNFWSKVIKSRKITDAKALEVGSKNGGLSLFLASEFKFKVTCTDLDGATVNARELHKKFNVSRNVEYDNADAAALKYESDSFDIVIFKSVLGSIGKNDNMERQVKAINEMRRVLKPGGILLFAENGKASFIHLFFRKAFRKWAAYWRYTTLDEMENMLKEFSFKEVHTAGFLSAFFSGKSMKKIIFSLDNFFEKMIPEKSGYMIYGYAVK